MLVVLVGALHRRWDREVGFSASSLHKRAASAIRGREVGFSACFLACESKMNRFTCFLLLCLVFRLYFVYAKKRERNKTPFVIRAILCLGDFRKRNFLSCVRNMCCWFRKETSLHVTFFSLYAGRAGAGFRPFQVNLYAIFLNLIVFWLVPLRFTFLLWVCMLS